MPIDALKLNTPCLTRSSQGSLLQTAEVLRTLHFVSCGPSFRDVIHVAPASCRSGRIARI